MMPTDGCVAAASADAARHNPPREAANRPSMLRPTSWWISASMRSTASCMTHLYLMYSERRQLCVAEVGDQHRARGVGDAELRPHGSHRSLRRDTARPEHRQLVWPDRHRIAIVRFADVRDADHL